MLNNNLGKRIKQLRRERHLTAELFADMVDISTSFVREIERGNKKPALDTFVAIANCLGVSADALLCDEITKAEPLMLNSITKKMKDLKPEQLQMVEAVFNAMLNEFSKSR